MKSSVLTLALLAGLSSQALAGGPWICEDLSAINMLPPYDNRFIGQARGTIYLLPDEGYTTNLTHARAFAACATQYPEEPLYSGGAGNSQTNTNGASTAYMTCGVPNLLVLNCYSRRGSNVSGVSNAALPPPQRDGTEDAPEVYVCGFSGASSLTYNEVDFLPGAAVGTGEALIDVTYQGSGSPSYSAEVSFWPSFQAQRLLRNGAVLTVGTTQVIVGVTSTANGVRALGSLTESNGVYTYAPQGSLPSSVPVQLGIRNFSFDDGAFDVNGDGRFNIHDLNALGSHLNTQDQDIIGRFDLDGSSGINQGDIDILESYIDVGLDSGVFGDANEDGVVDCSDRSGLLLEGYDLEDAEYVVTMDFNLDGLIDASDLAVADTVIPTADFNRDGGINATDISDFYDAYQLGDLSADLDQSGGVTADDLTLFFVMYGEGC